MSPRLMPSGASSSGEPVWAATANQHLVHAADATDSHYASLTAAGDGAGGSSCRFAPYPSPYVTGAAVDSTHSGISTGKGGVGKAIQNIYINSSSSQFPRWYLTNNGGIASSKRTVVRCQILISGTGLSNSSYVTSKFCQFENSGTGTQYSVKDPFPWTGSTNGRSTVWQPFSNTGWDDAGIDDDDAVQPVGPYLFDSVGTWRRFTFDTKPHSAAGVYDGWQRLYIDGTKVLDISASAVDVTPPGGTKVWCRLGKMQHHTTADGINPTLGLSFGGDTSGSFSLQPSWTQAINLGDADPTNLDTFAFWYED